MIICKTEFDYNLLKCIRSHGWTRYGNNTLNNVNNVNNKFCFVELGYNLRPMEFQGAMGSVQLNYIDERNIIRNTNYNNITKCITNHHKNNNILFLLQHQDVNQIGSVYILLNIDFHINE